MKYVWQNESNDIVKLSSDGYDYVVPTIHSKNPNYENYKRVLRYVPLVRRYCGKMPVSWPIGILFAENSGPKDVSYAGAVGLMQLLPSTAHKTTQQLMHPDINIQAGCTYLRELASLPGADLVTVASMYNAGELNTGRPHLSDKSPFGFAESEGYILKVISASNEFLLRPPVEEVIYP